VGLQLFKGEMNVRILPIAFLLLSGSLGLAAQTGCIEGKVFDTAGAPIWGIRVVGTSSAQRVSFDVGTDNEGYFRIDTVPAGDYELATSDEYRADSQRINFAGERNFALVPATAAKDGCSSITLRRPPRARIQLVAKDLLTAQAILGANASFRYGEKNFWSGAREEQDLLVPPLADLQVQVGAKGYENSAIIHVATLQPGERQELAIALRPIQLGCIGGQVVDQAGVPVRGVRVQPNFVGDHLGSQPDVRSTDKNGRFKFEGVHPGKYFIFTYAESLGYPVVSDFEDVASVSVQPSAGCSETTINLGPKSAQLQVQVVNALTQQPLKKFTASITGEHIWGGGWTLKVIQSPMPVPAFKSLEVYAEADGYRASHGVTVGPLEPEETRQITIELYPLASGATKSQR
jgi:hypothetical protein